MLVFYKVILISQNVQTDKLLCEMKAEEKKVAYHRRYEKSYF